MTNKYAEFRNLFEDDDLSRKDEFMNNPFRGVFMADSDEKEEEPESKDQDKEEEPESKDQDKEEDTEDQDKEEDTEEDSSDEVPDEGKGEEDSATPEENSEEDSATPEENSEEEQKDIDVSGKKIIIFNQYKRLSGILGGLKDGSIDLINNAVDNAILSEGFVLRDEINKTIGQVDFALALDFEKTDLVRLEELYTIIYEKIKKLVDFLEKLTKIKVRTES